MKTYKDTDLREALRRREARQTKPKVPADFLEKTMQQIDNELVRRTRRRLTLAALAAAASIALLLTLAVRGDIETEQTERQTAETCPRQSAKQHRATIQQATHVLTLETPAKHVHPKKELTKKATATQPLPPSSSLNHQTSLATSIEDELRQVSDDCYMQHLAKTIESDPQLSRMVDEFVNMTSDTTQTVYCAKSL